MGPAAAQRLTVVLVVLFAVTLGHLVSPRPDPAASGFALGAAVAVVRLIWLPRAREAFMAAHETSSMTNGALAEGINGVRAVQSMDRQRVNFMLYDDKAYANLQAHLTAARYAQIMVPIVDTLTGIAMAVVVVVGGPAKPLAIANPSPIPQRDRLGSNAPREMVEYWNTLFSRPDREGVKGLSEAMSKFDLAKEGVLQRISAPTLVITADRTKMHSVEEARAYQAQIPNSRLVVIRSDAYHIAAANADECVSHTLAFLKEQKQGH